jgi:hypothetical protein
MKKSFKIILLSGLAILLIGGCAAKEEGEMSSQTKMKGTTVSVSTGDSYEFCDNWKPGQTVNFSFVTSKPVDFDVHYHAKRDKFYPVKKGNVKEFSGSFTVESPNIHCLMWANNNNSYVKLTYDVKAE